MSEREETTRAQRDDAESLARIARHKCKHVEDGTCVECLKDTLSQSEARRTRVRAEIEEKMGVKKIEKSAEEQAAETRKNVKIIRIGCAVVIAAFVAWWVFSSWMEASTYAKLTGKDVSTWDAMWVELRVQEGAQD